MSLSSVEGTNWLKGQAVCRLIGMFLNLSEIIVCTWVLTEETEVGRLTRVV